MTISVDTFLERYSRQHGICMCTNCQCERRLRPYLCKCTDPRCVGWIIAHDAHVLRLVVEGLIDFVELSAYRKKLGKRYNTAPWIFSAMA